MSIKEMTGILLVIFIIFSALLFFIFRPKDRGKPYDNYFSALNEELKQKGSGTPILVLDLDRLDQNIQALMTHIGNDKHYRVVAKSLPSVKLIEYIFKKTDTSKVMVFHQPFINLLAGELPDSQMLLGKPMPINAVKTFYQKLNRNSDFDPSKQLQWLIDNPKRLKQYLEFAVQNNLTLLINIEIDVGLHRGGIQDTNELHQLLSLIEKNSQYLTFTGFMGYDAHVAKAPPLLSSRKSALQDVLDAYQNFIVYGKENFPKLFERELTFNSAGSMTYQLYKDITLVNDISAGSGLVKPQDFDMDTLKDHVAALFIATPVLKKNKGLQIPYVEFMASVWGWLNPNWKNTFFIYGGYWKAVYHQPEGLRQNPIYGYSSNQEIATGSEQTEIDIDDHVFLRPRQSEAVMLQFGDLVITRGSKIIDRWPVFRQ